MVTKVTFDQLPSLPQVLVQILDVIHSDNTDYQAIAKIIRHDAGIATRLMSVANSSYYNRSQGKNCDSIERALLFLGTDTVKTITITASIKQFFGNFNQQHSQFLQTFWRRSLISANCAQVLATLTGYNAPDEAYLCGLLADVGQLVLLTNNEQQYLDILQTANDDRQLLAAEQQLLKCDHCQTGADLVDSWEIEGFLGDAVRYHHEPDELLQDAHHLVKIVNLASQLSVNRDISDQALASANQLFGLNESLTRELLSKINNDIDKLANSLNIDISTPADNTRWQQTHNQLGATLSDISELAQINTSLLQAQNHNSLQQAAQRSLFLTLGISGSVLFLLNDEKNQLSAQSPATNSAANEPPALDFHLPLKMGRSLISDTFLQATTYSSNDSKRPLSVIDRQMLRYCQSDILVCWPLIATTPTKETVGVLVCAIKEPQLNHLQQRGPLLSSLCREIANAIINSRQRFDAINEQGPSAGQYQQHINEAVHEASNPLSIIRNYLEMLRLKLGDEHDANEGLNLIKEEIDRVGNILLRLKDSDQTTGNSALDINTIIKTTSHIFIESMCATHNINLELDLDSQNPIINNNPEHLKQVLTNLIKNAVEALESGQTITINTEATVSVSGRKYCAIYIDDNGPGIPADIKQNLFSPVISTKGCGHSGLGLSIAKKLVDDMGGSIVCRSKIGKGTQFQILLPQ